MRNDTGRGYLVIGTRDDGERLVLSDHHGKTAAVDAERQRMLFAEHLEGIVSVDVERLEGADEQ